MQVRISLNQEFFNLLVKQMVELEERIPDMLDEFFTGGLNARAVREREEFAGLLDEYLRHLERLVATAQVNDDETTTIPFVILGSTVTLQNIASGQVSEFTVVTPYETDCQAGKISFFSPLGKALLLKKPGDVFEIKAPGGTMQYKVIAIKC